MLAGDKSIVYLLSVPCNMWKKERAIQTGLCSAPLLLFSITLMAQKRAGEEEESKRRTDDRHAFIPISDLKKSA